MATGLTIQYELETDILVIRKCASYTGQETEDLGDLIIARRNPSTGDVELLEILSFLKRLGQGRLFQLPVDADLTQLAIKLQQPLAAE
ncbi:MAG: DUF2283 domain-containing protein [bacterium]